MIEGLKIVEDEAEELADSTEQGAQPPKDASD
jgi:hypothetical protein